MFRHERPQKGRYRQFFQTGVEVFGLEGPDVDAELLLLTARLWKQLGLERVSLQLNSLGTVDDRAQFRKQLVAWLGKHQDELDDDSRRRLESNPLRILDSKNPDVQALLEQAADRFEQANNALADGDLGRYQELVEEAEVLLADALDRIADAETSGVPPPTPTPEPTPTPTPEGA